MRWGLAHIDVLCAKAVSIHVVVDISCISHPLSSSSTMPAIQPGSLVLVTGASGFIAV